MVQKKAKILPSLCGNSSAGRAIPCQGIGREFEPRFPLQIYRIGSLKFVSLFFSFNYLAR